MRRLGLIPPPGIVLDHQEADDVLAVIDAILVKPQNGAPGNVATTVSDIRSLLRVGLAIRPATRSVLALGADE
jgi:hypothetical protein